MKIAVMQPYFLPYIGYFQLIAETDAFVVYDNIKYTKKGWINRNRLLLNDAGSIFTLPLKKDSDCLDIAERELATTFDPGKLLKQFKGAYGRAPYFAQVFSLLERIVEHEDRNLFDFVHHSIRCVCEHLGLKTNIHISSSIDIDHQLKSQDKLLAICHAFDADIYVNPIGGIALYSKDVFKEQGVDLKFLRSIPFAYDQPVKEFVPSLSIVDVLMFNSIEAIRERILNHYELI